MQYAVRQNIFFTVRSRSNESTYFLYSVAPEGRIEDARLVISVSC